MHLIKFCHLKKYLASLVMIGSLLFATPIFAAEKIDAYDVTLTIHADATVDVVEKIRYNFGDEDRHGIIRDIPVRYAGRVGNFNLRVSDLRVTDERGADYDFIISKQGNNKSVKIGDADAYVTGVKTYVISYTVDRAIANFSNHDELYWNAVGTGWDVPIDRAHATVMLPPGAAPEKIQYDCLVGAAGAKDGCEQKQLFSQTGVQQVSFQQGHLASQAGLTAVVGFPKGLVVVPAWYVNVWNILLDNWLLGLPVLVLVVCYLLWHMFGRDPGGRGTIVPEYDVPDNLTPGEMATIVEEKSSNRAMAAEIIYFAQRGYLKIVREEKKRLLKDSVDYLLEKKREPDDRLRPYEKMFLEKLYSHTEAIEAYNAAAPGERVTQTIRLSKLKQHFLEDYAAVKKSLGDETAAAGYFSSNPDRLRALWILVAIGFGFGSFFTVERWGWVGFVSVAVSGVIAAFFSRLMPRHTSKGVETKRLAEGFKMYLSVAEKDRLEFHNAPEKNPETFEKFLPFAIALGVETAWAKQFEGMAVPPPTWYAGTPGHAFLPLAFARDMGDFRSVAASAIAAPAARGGSGFGGGGFSGGGFGGGGGRSW